MSNNSKKNIKILENSFNKVITGMIEHLVTYYDYTDSNICKMKNMILESINNYPEEPISCFILNIYNNDEYRYYINNEDETFFLGETYDNITDGDENMIMKIFEFKTLWKQLDNDTKNFIKKSMKTLVQISRVYILNL